MALKALSRRWSEWETDEESRSAQTNRVVWARVAGSSQREVADAGLQLYCCPTKNERQARPAKAEMFADKPIVARRWQVAQKVVVAEIVIVRTCATASVKVSVHVIVKAVAGAFGHQVENQHWHLAAKSFARCESHAGCCVEILDVVRKCPSKYVKRDQRLSHSSNGRQTNRDITHAITHKITHLMTVVAAGSSSSGSQIRCAHAPGSAFGSHLHLASVANFDIARRPETRLSCQWRGGAEPESLLRGHYWKLQTTFADGTGWERRLADDEAHVVVAVVDRGVWVVENDAVGGTADSPAIEGGLWLRVDFGAVSAASGYDAMRVLVIETNDADVLACLARTARAMAGDTNSHGSEDVHLEWSLWIHTAGIDAAVADGSLLLPDSAASAAAVVERGRSHCRSRSHQEYAEESSLCSEGLPSPSAKCRVAGASDRVVVEESQLRLQHWPQADGFHSRLGVDAIVSVPANVLGAQPGDSVSQEEASVGPLEAATMPAAAKASSLAQGHH